MTRKPLDEGGGGKTESAAGLAGRCPDLGENSRGREKACLGCGETAADSIPFPVHLEGGNL